MIDMDVRTNYSSNVRLRLEAEGRSWRLAKIGPECFVPMEPFELSPCNARIIMTIDGDDRCWNVQVLGGVTPFDTSVQIRYR